MPLRLISNVFLIALCAPLFTSFITGCATGKTELATCEHADWYELGRRDGSQGAASDRLTQQRASCGKNFRSDWETMYINGRNAGLVEYCEPKNAYELGRMGIAYLYVCPSTVEPPFVSAYRKGQLAHDLELENKRLELQIDQLSQRLLVADNKYDQKELSSELEELKKLRNQKAKELSKIIAN